MSLKLLRSLGAGLDLHGEVNLLGGSEKVHLADLLEVHADGIAREHHRGGVLTATSLEARALLGALGGGGNRGNLLARHIVFVVIKGADADVAIVIVIVVARHLDIRVRVAVVVREDLDATGTKGPVEILELVIIHVDVTKSDLNLILADGTDALGAIDKLTKHPLEIGGELGFLLCLLTRCHGLPLDMAVDAQLLLYYPVIRV